MFIPTVLYVLQIAVRCSEELIRSLLCKTKGLSDFCSGRNQYHGRMIEFLLNDLFELLSFYDHDILRQKYLTCTFAVFQLEKTFKTTFSLLVLHMWLVLRRLKEEGKDGVKFGQYIYEMYNHDVELRVSKAGVSCLAVLYKFVYGYYMHCHHLDPWM
jgi:hypothetical protein